MLERAELWEIHLSHHIYHVGSPCRSAFSFFNSMLFLPWIGCQFSLSLSLNRVRVHEPSRHTPIQNSREYPPRVSSLLRMREPLKLFLLFPILLLFKYFCAQQTSEDTKYRCRNSDIYGSSPYYQSTSHWPGNRNKQKLSNCHWTRESKDNNIIISFDILALYLGYSLFADLRQNYDPLPVTTGRM